MLYHMGEWGLGSNRQMIDISREQLREIFFDKSVRIDESVRDLTVKE